MKPVLLEEVKQVLHAELKTPLVEGAIRGVSTDSRQNCQGRLFFALRGDNFDGHDFVDAAVEAGAAAVVVDRKLPLSEAVRTAGVCVMKVDDTVAALGAMARFYRRSLGRSLSVIAVTGSNGKTTTREMIYHVLSKNRVGYRSPENFNNSIGVPLTLLAVEPKHEFVVVEIGTSQQGEVAALSRIAEPDIAIITHVAPAHLAGLKDIDQVSVEKVSIVSGLQGRGVVICGTSHAPTLERIRTLGHRVISFGLDGSADVSARWVEQRHGRVRFETNDHCQVELPIGGVHNVTNALAALAAVRRLQLTSRDFAEAMKDFAGAVGRMEYHHVNGITIIDDTYNANPASMSAALDDLASHKEAARRIFVCGDMCELGEQSESYHRELGQAVAAADVELLLTVGSEAATAATAAVEAGMGRGSVQRAVSSVRLARLIKSLIRDGDVIAVKGSRAMKMELVVAALRRYRGGRRRLLRTTDARKRRTASRERRRQAITSG